MTYKSIATFNTRNSFLHKHLNPPLKNNPRISSSLIKYESIKNLQEDYMPEKIQFSDLIDLESSKKNLLENYGYLELGSKPDDFSILIPELEISVELIAIGSSIRPSFGQQKGAELATELKDYQTSKVSNTGSNMCWNLFRFEKIEMPWKSHWVVTDINGFMFRKFKDYYELPSSRKFEDLDDLYTNKC